jgi:hypothetical protein
MAARRAQCRIEQRGCPWANYTDSMKRNTIVARVLEADAGLERIKHLEEQLAPAPVNSRQRRTLSAAIRFEADAYRKSLDTEQATATHDAKPQPAVGLGFLNGISASRKPTIAPHRRIGSRSRSAPRR